MAYGGADENALDYSSCIPCIGWDELKSKDGCGIAA